MAISPTRGLGKFAGAGRYSAPLVALGENCTNCGGGAAANAGAAIASAPARASVTLSMVYSSGVDVRLAAAELINIWQRATRNRNKRSARSCRPNRHLPALAS